MEKVLLIEDNTIVSKTIERKLIMNGFQVDCCFSAEDALIEINKHHYDIVVLDLNLPKMSGYSFLQILRKKSDIPVIINTSYADVKSRVKLINIGANDFIEKSFEPDEIIESIKIILEDRLKQKESTKILQFKDLQIDLFNRTVKKSNEVLELTNKEFDILKMLIDNPDRAFSRKQLYLVVWGEEYDESVDNTINVHIKRLRNKIEIDPKNPDVIGTVYAFGYRLGEEFASQLRKAK
ncbi:MAG: response regulator transcription factor [Bacilli bacterium]|nr:response regulator transcription factor [Bacilli bacterium]